MAEGGYDPMDTPTEETPLIPDTEDDDDCNEHSIKENLIT